MAAKTPREEVHVDDKNWSGWRKAIRSEPSAGYVHRGQGQEGYKLNNMEVPNGNKCGIYEWKIVMPDNPGESKVVYVGSTCRVKKGSLNDRIKEYSNNGSHKEILFNEHIRRGYDLWYRTKPAGNKQQAEGMENKLLDLYDYLWNVRRN